MLNDSLTEDRYKEQIRSSFDGKFKNQFNEGSKEVKKTLNQIDKTLKYPYFH